MQQFLAMVGRNIKLFFKDKGVFFTSLITPLILLLLYSTFLSNVYEDSFTSSLPEFFKVSDDLIGGVVGGQLISSLLAVSCVTVSFCANMIMVNDKVTGVDKDFHLTAIKKPTLALSYYVATTITTLIVAYVAMGAGFIYLGAKGWFLSVADVFLIIADVFILVTFGTALSSVINYFLTTQGQISAVGTIVSSCYGFICGAYMPIASFGEGLQKALSFLPGTYGTALIKNHVLGGTFEEMIDQGFPSEVVERIKDSIDCNIYFFGDKISTGAMYGVMLGAILILIAVYVLLHVFDVNSLLSKRPKKSKTTQKPKQ